MKILITMAGKGSRFRNAGTSCPKHEIVVNDQYMFDWAMKSLDSFFDYEFIFVTYDGHSSTNFIKDGCKRLGIENFEIVTIDEFTDGQAATALKADELIHSSEPVAIYNIDTYIEEGNITPSDICGDGFIPAFNAEGDRWSFIKLNSSDEVQSVSEKEKISDNATVGFYYFDKWSYFTEAYRIAASEVESAYGEQYVAPLYNQLIDNGHSVRSVLLREDSVHVLGTPDDVRDFYPEFDPMHH